MGAFVLMAVNNSAPLSEGKILKYTFAIDKSDVTFTFETEISKFETAFFSLLLAKYLLNLL